MLQANVLETKNSLSEFLRFLESGKEDCIVIARHNKPVAKITLYDAPPPRIASALRKQRTSTPMDGTPRR